MSQTKPFKILSLDGGGAKGFYTLGVLKEVEALLQSRISDAFDLVYGTSTGSIIAALLCQGRPVCEVHELYKDHVVPIMAQVFASGKSEKLNELALEVFGDCSFKQLQTRLAIVATNWKLEKPLIFKTHPDQAFGRTATFEPGFGIPVADAVVASCSAYPFFEKKDLTASDGREFEAIDGGFCANNPSLFAMTDATNSLGIERSSIRLLSIGCGQYPEPKKGLFSISRYASKLTSVKLLKKTLESNINSMEQLLNLTYSDVARVRVNDRFSGPDMATDLFESNLALLDTIFQAGSNSFSVREEDIRTLLNG